MSFLIESAVKKHGLSVEGKIRVIADMEESLAAVDDGVARTVYIKALAERVGVDEGAILEKVKNVIKRRSAGRSAAPAHSTPGEPDKAPPDFTGSAQRERAIIAMMIHAPDTIAEIDRRQVLDYFDNALLQAVGWLILENRRLVQEGRLGDLPDMALDDNQKHVITSLTVGDELCNWEDSAAGCRRLVDQVIENRRHRRDSLTRMIKSAEETKDQKLDDLLRAKKEQQRDRRKKIMLYEGEKLYDQQNLH